MSIAFRIVSLCFPFANDSVSPDVCFYTRLQDGQTPFDRAREKEMQVDKPLAARGRYESTPLSSRSDLTEGEAIKGNVSVCLMFLSTLSSLTLSSLTPLYSLLFLLSRLSSLFSISSPLLSIFSRFSSLLSLLSSPLLSILSRFSSFYSVYFLTSLLTIYLIRCLSLSAASSLAPSVQQHPLAPDIATMQLQSHRIAEISSLVDRMLQQQQQQQQQHQIVDSRVTQSPQECAEDGFISDSARLGEYYQFVQKCLNQSFLAVVVMGTGMFKVDASSTVMEGLKIIARSLPVASGLLASAVFMGVEKVGEAKKVAKYANLGRLNPSADPLVSRYLSVKIARALTLQYHSEIEKGVFVKEKSRLSRMKNWFVESVRCVDEELARGVFGENLSGSQIVALDHARLALSAVMHMREDELHTITSSESNMIASLLDAVAREYKSSGRAQIDPLSSSFSSSSTFSPSSSLSVAGSFIGGGGSGGGGGGVVMDSYPNKIKALEEENAMSKRKAADAEKKAADAEKKAADAEKKAADARIAAKDAESMAANTKRTVDAFFNTSTGVDGQVRTTRVDDGRLRVFVENPEQDERLNGVTGHVMSQDERIQELERQMADTQREKERRKKKGGWKSVLNFKGWK